MPGPNVVQSGRSNFLYYNSAYTNGTGTGYGTPTWVVIDRIGDLDRGMTKNATEVDMRASATTITVFGNKTRELSFTYYKKQGTADTVFNALRASFETDNILDIKIQEEATGTVGSLYDRGPFIVSEMTKAEPIAGVESYDFKLKVVDAEQTAGVPFLYEVGLVQA